MQTKATEINFNPFWTVPPSLIKKDLIPKMQADPELSDRREDPRLQQGGPGGFAAVDQLEQRRGDPLQVPPGSGRRPQLARLRARQHPQPLWRLHARHAVEGHFRRRLPLRLLGLRARAGRARLCRLAARGQSRLGPRPDRRGDPLRRARRRQADDAGRRSTGSTSPPGRRRTASCSSVPTSISATAPGRARSLPTFPPSRSRMPQD